MGVYFITFRSITPAQQGEALLRKKGYRSLLQRTPHWMQENGCGYCLRLSTGKIEEVIGHLHRGNVAFRKVYRQLNSGDWEEVAL